jgi:hypothetical protein
MNQEYLVRMGLSEKVGETLFEGKMTTFCEDHDTVIV